MNTHSQFTLSEFLGIILFVGLYFTGIRIGGFIIPLMFFLAMLLSIGMAIAALVARGRFQAFAIGFTIPVLVYAFLLLIYGPRPADPSWKGLLTSQMIEMFYKTNATLFGRNLFAREAMMLVGHILTAMLLGYAGARFALLLYNREQACKE